MGTSDIHGLISWDYDEKGSNRPITLVFAKEKSLESLQEALIEGRTVAVYNALMVGKPEYLIPLIHASIHVTSAQYLPNTQILKVELTNNSSSSLLFENQMDYTFYSSSPVFEIPAQGTYTLFIKTIKIKESIDLKLRAIGTYVAPKQSPDVVWNISVEK